MKKKTTELYKTVWRWHFYAGIFVAPFLIVLAITGGTYLFKPQIEQALYHSYYEVKEESTKMDADAQVAVVQKQYPEGTVTSFKPSSSPTRSSEVGLAEGEATYTVFLNPYNGEVIKKLDNHDRIMDRIEELHGELMVGTWGDRLVELVTCWVIVLIITGVYLWFPRKSKKEKGGTFLIRFNKGGRALRRDLHAVPAVWLTAGIAFLIATGLPWSGFWGTNFQSIVTNTGQGYPPSIWTGNPPDSVTQTKDLTKVPWAAETLEVPKSTIIPNYERVSLTTIEENAEKRGVPEGYKIVIPQTAEGVYTISAFPNKAQDEVTMHLDQYTGAVLTDYRYDNYGWMGKAIALGITLHKGTQFGLINQLISVLICVGIVLVVCSGIYLWWKRKPSHQLGAPKSGSARHAYGFYILLVVLGIIFPLVGLSLIVIFLLDFLVIRRVAKLKKFFNA